MADSSVVLAAPLRGAREITPGQRARCDFGLEQN